MDETGKEISLRRLLIIIAAVVFSLPLFHAVSRLTVWFGQRHAVSDFEDSYPAARILETKYTGTALHPTALTVYAYDTEYGFTFITEYERQSGSLVRKETNDGCFNERLGMRRDLAAVTEIIPQYLKTPYLVLFYPDNSPGFFLVTEEKDHEILLTLYEALRSQIRAHSTGISFAIEIPEEEIYAKLEATDYAAVLCEERYYRKPWTDFSAGNYPILSIAAEAPSCHSLFIDYVTDTEKYFAKMDGACQANKTVLQARELCFQPGHDEIIMAVYVNSEGEYNADFLYGDS